VKDEPVVRRRLHGADSVIGDEYFAVRTSGGGVDGWGDLGGHPEI